MPELMVFSKHLAGPPLEESARRLAEFGVAAIDLTVRPKGHVDPSRAPDELPALAERLHQQGSRVGMLTTSITDATDSTTRPILATAAKLGIRHVKLGYWDYAGFGTLAKLRAEVRAKVKDIAAICAELG